MAYSTFYTLLFIVYINVYIVIIVHTCNVFSIIMCVMSI